MMAGLARFTSLPDGSRRLTTAIITVNPNEVLQSVGHNRSPALLRNGAEANKWLHGDKKEALNLLRPYQNEAMGVEPIPMAIKIPGNQAVNMPPCLLSS